MPTFAVRKDTRFETKQQVFVLIRDGRCLMDEFEAEIKADKNLKDELGTLVAILRHVANRIQPFLPDTKYKILAEIKSKHQCSEAKSKNLRLYMLAIKGIGLVMTHGGKKVDQRNDLKLLKQIAKEYSNQ